MWRTSLKLYVIIIVFTAVCLSQAHHEAGSNQYEVNFDFDEAMLMADRHAFVKYMIKVSMKENNIISVFYI